MHILTVIPIARGVFREELTYFTTEEVPLGSLVRVPLRERTIHALVIKKEDAREQKATLKSQAFTVKKIAGLAAEQFLAPSFILACERTAEYFAQPMGQVLACQIPRSILATPPKTELTPETVPEIPGTVSLLQEAAPDRFGYLKRHIRERFAQKQSVFFIAPTIADIEEASSLLEKGIEQYTFVLHGSLSDKEVVRRWQKALASLHPVLVVATPYFLSLPLARLGVIILDQEHSLAYKTIARPHFDHRTFAKLYTECAHIDLLYADRLLSLETLEKFTTKTYSVLTPLKFRPHTEATCKVVDMRPVKNPQRAPEGFRVLSREVEKAIKETVSSGTQLFLFAQRKGLAPTTICQDCETIVSCTHCGTPLVLYTSRRGSETKQRFRCPMCHIEKPVDDRCVHCASWRFAMLGIGIEKVRATLAADYPDLNVFVLDAEHVKSHEAARKLVRDFQVTPGSVLLGTEMSLYYLRTPLARTAVVSLDALFAIPNFRMREKIMHLLLQLRELSTRDFVIQTRKPDDPLFDLLVRGDCMTWYQDELAERKQFNYPPYSVLIRVSGDRADATGETEMRALHTELTEYHPQLYAPRNRTGSKERLHLLLRIAPNLWPNRALVDRLKLLPPQYTVQVDPESLL